MIRRIHKRLGIIIIFVSHNMTDIANLSDRIIVMDHGKIALEGTPEQVYSHEKELKEMGLDVPPAREIINKIKTAVPGIKSNALSIEQAAEDIKTYMSETGK
jgi:energy-coupling factor transport system ATP-binding protein